MTPFTPADYRRVLLLARDGDAEGDGGDADLTAAERYATAQGVLNGHLHQHKRRDGGAWIEITPSGLEALNNAE